MNNVERLENLKRLKREEEMSSEKSQNYIDDLNLTIKMVEHEISRGKPSGYEMIKEN